MTATLWVALAGTIATLLGTLLRLRHERKLAEKARADAVEDARQAAEESREKVKGEAESIAVAAANSAVKTVADALDVTQEELAGLVGATRPTVNQILQSLADQGAVALSRGKIEIRSRKVLTRLT